MGGEESRVLSPSGSINRLSLTGAAFPNCGTTSANWALLHQTTKERWVCGHAEAANFREMILECEGTFHKDCSPSFCTTKQGIYTAKPLKVFSIRKRSKFLKLVEHFEYNCIPAHMSSIHNFRLSEVLCVLDGLVIIQFVRNFTVQFGLVNYRKNKLLGVFGRQTLEQTSEGIHGQLSPNGSVCLVRTPRGTFLRRRKPNSLQLYCMSTFALLWELDVGDSPNCLAFDPRFPWQRIACTNYTANSLNELALVDIDRFEVAERNTRCITNYPALSLYLKSVRYCRDGRLIVATVVDAICRCNDRNRLVECNVHIYGGDTAQLLHIFTYNRLACTRHMCPTNYLPVVSECDRYLAVTMNQAHRPAVTLVQVFQLPQPTRLQQMCRAVILQHCPIELTQTLPLPVKMVEFLHYKDEYCYQGPY